MRHALALCLLLLTANPLFAEEKPRPELVRLTVESGVSTLNGARSGTQLLATAFDASGNPYDVTDEVAWDGGGGIRVDSIGWAGPVVAGKQAVSAKLGGLSARIELNVVRPEFKRPTEFLHEVIPSLTRAGCNQGGCHGTPTGKNGFRLSLRGYLPDQDREVLTREFEGRRIDRVEPEKSLLLRKGTGEVFHQGGQRFNSELRTYGAIRDWIAEGARPDAAELPKLTSIEVFPKHQVLDYPSVSRRFAVRATFSNGVVRDVTPFAKFSTSDEAIVRVDTSGQARRVKKGEATILVGYENLIAAAQVVFRDAYDGTPWKGIAESNYIDKHLNAKWKQMRINPSQIADDAMFLRRVYFDVLGIPPTPSEARGFLGSKDPKKRDKLIDALFDRPEYVDNWTMKWSDRLGCNQRFTGFKGAYAYHRWIRDNIAANTPFDQFVRAIVTARGPNYTNPPASFYRRIRTPEDAAESVSQLFMGMRIQCAKCHNHVAEKWTQDDYYGFAAFFSQVKYKNGPQFFEIYNKEETVYLASESELRQPRTGRTMAPTALGAEPSDGKLPDRREALADWLVSPANPYFAKAAVNRIWFHLFGKGIVDPVDDMRDSNPPASAELLDALANDFKASGFDVKRLIKTILKSHAYQLSSETNATNADDSRYFSHAIVRLHPAEHLLDAVSTITGKPERLFHLPNGTTASQIPDGEFAHPFLRSFGQPRRSEACECERESDSTLEQALQLIAGRTVHNKIVAEENRLADLIKSKSNDQLVSELFLACIGREPTEQEKSTALAPFHDESEKGRRKAAEDLLWALFNHPEFLFQH